MSDAKQQITTDAAPKPPANFSQGVSKGGVLAVAGQVGFDADGAIIPGLVEQTRQALRHVGAILEAGGAGWEDTLMMRVYLTDTAHFAELNKVYDEWFAERGVAVPPARTTVYVGLPAGLLVEIDALAVTG